MFEHHSQAAQELETFASQIRSSITEASFETPLALPFWVLMKPHAEENLLQLEQAIPRLKAMDSGEYHRFNNILEFSRKALKWAAAKELKYIEALSDTSALLLKRLLVASMVRATETGIQTVEQTTVESKSAGAAALDFQELQRLIQTITVAPERRPPYLPSWLTATRPDTTPAPAGVYS